MALDPVTLGPETLRRMMDGRRLRFRQLMDMRETAPTKQLEFELDRRIEYLLGQQQLILTLRQLMNDVHIAEQEEALRESVEFTTG